MSSDPQDFMVDDDEEYDLQYSEESAEEPDVDLENQYYNSKALKEESYVKALDSFKKVISMEGEDKSEWGFKTLKQMIKIYFQQGDYENMMTCYKKLLTYIKNAVTRNYSEKSINSILDLISTYNLSKNDSQNKINLLQEFYEETLKALKEARNERLWFKTNTKLGKLYFDQGDYAKVFKIIRQLHQSCLTDEGEDDLKKGTQLLEIYALEIQVYTAQKNNKKLKQLYENCLQIKSAIPHPLIMGVIRECGGKMHLREQEYEKAFVDFFEAFKNYDEAGSIRRLTCLKYLVLTNMLLKSDINPFESQETKPYKDDPEIIAMTDLVDAYQNGDIVKFESVLNNDTLASSTSQSEQPITRTTIMEDAFIREHVEELLKNIRTQVLMSTLVKPYKRLKLEFIADRLNVHGQDRIAQIEKLLVSLILDGILPEECKIDPIGKLLILIPDNNSNNTTVENDDESIPPYIRVDGKLIENPNKKSACNNLPPKPPNNILDYHETNINENALNAKYKALQELSSRINDLQTSIFRKIPL